MVSAKDFVQQVWIPLLEGWGYIYGTAGRLWTEALQRAWSEPPHKNWEKTKAYGSRWIGKRVTDCSGLPLWALKQLGEEIVHHARYQYTDACKKKGKLVKTSSVGSADTFPRGEGSCGVIRDDGKPLLPGTAVFLQGNQEHIHHVGVYVGHGICIEAKGTQWGVVTSEPDHWDHWGELKAVDYSGEIRRISEGKDGDVGEESVEHGSVQCGGVKVVDYTKAADIENEPIPEVPEHREDKDGDPSQAQGAAGDGRPDTGTLFRVVVDNPGRWLNVRSGPGTSYQVLFRVEKGDVADVLAVSENGTTSSGAGAPLSPKGKAWYQIRCDGRVGWASAEYLSVVDEEPDAPDDVPEPESIIDALKDELKRMREELDAFQELIDELEGMYHG